MKNISRHFQLLCSFVLSQLFISITCYIVFVRYCIFAFYLISYLQEIGLKRAKSVLTSGADTDLIEELVRILLFQREQLSGTQPLESESIALDAAAAIDPAPVGSAGSSCGDPGAADSAVGPVPTNTAAEEEEDAAEGGKQRAFDCIALVKWLLALTEFDRFDMYVRFAGKQQMEQIVSTFESALTTSGELLTAKTASKIEAAVRRCRGK